MRFYKTPPPTPTTHNRLGRKLLEKDIEAYGAKRFKELGWSFEKFSSPQKRSVPDRLCGAGRGFTFFIEFKAPGKTATKSQQQDHQRRRAREHVVFVVDSYEQLEVAIDIAARIEVTCLPYILPDFLLS